MVSASMVVIKAPIFCLSSGDKNRFSTKLEDHLDFITKNVRPVKEFSHFNKALLERFVLEHNENLKRSLTFLSANHDGQLGALRVYDVQECLDLLASHVNRYKNIYEYLHDNAQNKNNFTP